MVVVSIVVVRTHVQVNFLWAAIMTTVFSYHPLENSFNAHISFCMAATVPRNW